MPKPQTRNELLKLSEINFDRLLEFIDRLPGSIKNRVYTHNELNDRDKTVSDVICHVHEWHLMLENWYKRGMAGEKPAIPAEGVSWQTLPKVNRPIYEKYKGTKLTQALLLLKKSYKTIMDIIKNHNDEELFTKKKYEWTRTTSMGYYLISLTSSHYDWAFRTIKPLKKLVK